MDIEKAKNIAKLAKAISTLEDAFTIVSPILDTDNGTLTISSNTIEPPVAFSTSDKDDIVLILSAIRDKWEKLMKEIEKL